MVAARFLSDPITASGGHAPEMLAGQRRPTGTVSPTVREYRVDPQLEQRWRAIPVGRILQDDEIGSLDGSLLGLHVDIVIGIAFVEIMYGDTG